MPGLLLGFGRRCATDRLPPCHIESAEHVHPETFEVDPGGFGGRTEYVSLQVAIVERPATLAEKDVLVFLALTRSSIFQEFTPAIRSAVLAGSLRS